MALERKLNKMRSFTFPRLSTASRSDDQHQDQMDSRISFPPAHSRDSSSASSSSSPLTPTFSTRSHARWPSSCSSLASTPDSPVNVNKATLEDLVEEVEKEDALPDHQMPEDEPFCICDTPYCEHRQSTDSRSPMPEWFQGDDLAYNHDSSAQRRPKRSSSTEFASSIFGSRRNARWNSTSGRWLSRRPTLSVSSQTVRSAPPTPGASRRPSASQALISSLDPRQTVIYSSPTSHYPADRSWTTSVVEPTANIDVRHSGSVEDPIDREELSSTPILPHLLAQMRDKTQDSAPSPVQSPITAPHSETASVRSPSVRRPGPSGLLTPPLSAKPSIASGLRSTAGFSNGDTDIWDIRLGHANFEIEPQPYYPQTCTSESCKRLLDDWESARMEFMRVIARVSEHYGPSSPTYKLSEEKWAEIDKEWRFNFEQANAEAETNGETPVSQCLAETQPISKMPSLTDPNQPTKFLNVQEADIVGPMVQYVKYQPPSPTTKKPGFFSMLKDPVSLLGRSIFTSKR